MLTKKQWLWCAEHDQSIRQVAMLLIALLGMYIAYIATERFWWENKLPINHQAKNSMVAKFNCQSEEVSEMFIPSLKERRARNGDLRDYQVSPLERGDARPLLLENYQNLVIGSEILQRRPECLGAFIADKQDWPQPFVFLVVDRKTGETVFRIARTRDYLKR